MSKLITVSPADQKTLAKLNEYKNLAMVVRKSDDERRRVGHNTGTIGEQLQDCGDPAEIGVLAMRHGISLDEIQMRAKSAPNFGQFRMVLGNRLVAILRRVEGGMSLTDAAYPKAAKKAAREAARLAKAAAKSSEKKVAKKIAKKVEAPAPAAKKVAKKIKTIKQVKTGKKTAAKKDAAAAAFLAGAHKPAAPAPAVAEPVAAV